MILQKLCYLGDDHLLLTLKKAIKLFVDVLVLNMYDNL